LAWNSLKISLALFVFNDYNKLMLGHELKMWRKKWQLTQEKLAGMLGAHRVTIAQWETGRRTIPSYLPLALEALEMQLKAGGGKDGPDS
jgi:DNA-binding XRE family transcriptional regulator